MSERRPTVVFYVSQMMGIADRFRRLRISSDRLFAGAATRVVTREQELGRALDTLSEDDIVVGVGGDGTMTKLMSTLWTRDRTDLKIGTIPLGTGNAFAHASGCGDPRLALRWIARGHACPQDLMVTDCSSLPTVLCSLSVGWESRCVEQIARRRPDGPPWQSVLRSLPTAGERIRGVRLQVDGRDWVRPSESLFNVGLYNTPCYAFGRRAHPQCVLDDGRGEVVVHETPWPYWRRMVLGAVAGSVEKTVRQATWREAVLQSPFPLQYDGEPVDLRAVSVRLVPRAVKIIVGAPRARDTVDSSALEGIR